jgi:SAM-dependent methyltransferase
MTTDPLAEARAIATSVSGWDLSAIRTRRLDPGPAWDYEAEARALLASAGTSLDIGTGGGEVLSRLAQSTRGSLVATEQWPPNASLSAKRLAVHGVPVVQAVSLQPPFRDGAFDFVLSRHEEIEPAEIDRILRPGGALLTQQVSADHWPELRRFIPRQTVFPNHDVEYPAAFEAMGYAVDVRRVRFRTAFATIADLAAMLLVAPWEVPHFDLDSDREALLAAERDLGTADGIVVSEGLYILTAQKPV